MNKLLYSLRAMIVSSLLLSLTACSAVNNGNSTATSSASHTLNIPTQPLESGFSETVGGSIESEREALEISASPPTGMYIPSENTDLVIAARVYPMQPCQEVIDPPRDGNGFGEVYYCTDFALPGTSSEGKTVIAGHASKYVNTWLNRLQVQGDVMMDRKIYLSTEESGDNFLTYTVTGVYRPSKEDLPYMTDVWGVPGESTSGRLIVVTCLLNSDGSSTSNYVVVAELSGTTSA